MKTFVHIVTAVLALALGSALGVFALTAASVEIGRRKLGA